MSEDAVPADEEGSVPEDAVPDPEPPLAAPLEDELPGITPTVSVYGWMVVPGLRRTTMFTRPALVVLAMTEASALAAGSTSQRRTASATAWATSAGSRLLPRRGRTTASGTASACSASRNGVSAVSYTHLTLPTNREV